MIGSYGHNDPWAEKLQDIALPEADDAWKAMSVMLDKEMPRMPGKDRRRWILLIILLLLLLGLCNCPGRWRSHQMSERQTSRKEAGGVDAGGKGRAEEKANEKNAGGEKVNARSIGGATANERGTDEHETGGSVVSEMGTPAKERDKTNRGEEESARKEKIRKETGGRAGRDAYGREGNGKVRSGKDNVMDDPDDKAAGNDYVEETSLRKSDASDTASQHPTGKQPGGSKQYGKVSGKKDSLTAETPALKDKKKRPLHPDRGWVVGIGLNQFFTLGQQQKSDYNSNGTTGHWGDYLPVPMVRYYFNRKLYLQLEAQLNAPQYTRKGLTVSQTKVIDTTGGRDETTLSSVSVQKLFYFNLPLSVHYSPFPHFYVGAGLQFARLTNGVGQFGVNVSQPGLPDTVTQKVKSLKEDSIYQQIKTTEFRWLLDMSYTYKHFVLGLRYNQALRNFIHVQLSTTGQIVQARNSSLQLYLRYILWDSRKKKAASTP